MREFKTTRRPLEEWCAGPRSAYKGEGRIFQSFIVIDLDSQHQAPCGGRGWMIIEDWDGLNANRGVCEHVIVIGD